MPQCRCAMETRGTQLRGGIGSDILASTSGLTIDPGGGVDGFQTVRSGGSRSHGNLVKRVASRKGSRWPGGLGPASGRACDEQGGSRREGNHRLASDCAWRTGLRFRPGGSPRVLMVLPLARRPIEHSRSPSDEVVRSHACPEFYRFPQHRVFWRGRACMRDPDPRR